MTSAQILRVQLNERSQNEHTFLPGPSSENQTSTPEALWCPCRVTTSPPLKGQPLAYFRQHRRPVLTLDVTGISLFPFVPGFFNSSSHCEIRLSLCGNHSFSPQHGLSCRKSPHWPILPPMEFSAESRLCTFDYSRHCPSFSKWLHHFILQPETLKVPNLLCLPFLWSHSGDCDVVMRFDLNFDFPD